MRSLPATQTGAVPSIVRHTGTGRTARLVFKVEERLRQIKKYRRIFLGQKNRHAVLPPNSRRGKWLTPWTARTAQAPWASRDGTAGFFHRLPPLRVEFPATLSYSSPRKAEHARTPTGKPCPATPAIRSAGDRTAAHHVRCFCFLVFPEP